VTFIDLDIWEIPDEISLPGIALGAALRPFAFDVPWWSGLAGAALGAAFLAFVRWAYQVTRGTEGMGLGDVKLIAMIGAFLGPGGLIPCILVASLAGSVIGGVVLLVARRRGEGGAQRPATPEPTTPEPTTESSPGDGDEDDWTPPPTAVPFGPFLALGALAQLLFGPALRALFLGLGRGG
jgi:leader peptidase (prepilin peptidase)/N-methyltransferase